MERKSGTPTGRRMYTQSKYRSKRKEVDGITFASKKESVRYSELKMLERAGEIRELKLQQRFPIVIRGVTVCTYVCDFAYIDRRNVVVIEDTKGYRTDIYKLKKKLFEAYYAPAKITET